MITTITGANQFEAREYYLSLISGDDKLDQQSIIRIDGSDTTPTKISEALTAQSLFGGNDVVVLQTFAGNKEVLEALPDLIDNTPEDTHFVIYETGLDKRTKAYKYAKKKTDFKEFGLRDARDLEQWVVDVASTEGVDISKGDAQFLVYRVAEDQWKLSHELKKMSALTDKIDRKLIEDIVEPTPRDTIFELLDAAISGNAKQATAKYHALRFQNVEPHYILGMIVWQLHILTVVTLEKDKSQHQIASEHKMSPFVVGKAKRGASRLNKNQIKKTLSEVQEADNKMKTTAIDSDLAVENLLVSIATLVN